MENNETRSEAPHLICPDCGSSNVTMQVFQEDAGTTTVSRTKSKYKEKRHGLLWWLLIGWWWWIIDLIMWIVLFPIKLILAVTRKKKYKGKSTTVSQSVNQVKYKTMCVCGTCGYTWVVSETSSDSDSIKKLKKKVR